MILLVYVVALTSSLALGSDICIEQGTENCSKPWFVWFNDSCHCGSSLSKFITCGSGKVDKIRKCFCMTRGKEENSTVVGICPYTCGASQSWFEDENTLEDEVCNISWHRTGQLCSQCIDGYGPPVYSYGLQCVVCSKVKWSISLFLLSFLLLTVFCLTIITLRISVARPPMSTFVLVCQVMTSPQYLSLIFVPASRDYSSPYVSKEVHQITWKLFASFFGVWNLDMFRSFYPEICLSPRMSTIQAESLEFLIALFPLVLLLVIYISSKLYNRGYKIIHCLCRPLISFLARLRQTVNVQTSLIDAFATFIILSVNKVGYTSFGILQPIYVYSPCGNTSIRPYIEPDIKYFGWGNIPYALAALLLSFLLILIPLLLLFLYPLKVFQRFLNNRQWQCSTLHIFADSFQGCYKNGTNGTRDYRWFAGLHLLLRFIIVLFYDLSNYYNVNGVFMSIAIGLYVGLLAVFQPYKRHLHLKFDILLLFGLLMWCTALQLTLLDSASHYNFYMHVILLAVSALIPSLFLISCILHWMLGKKVHRWMAMRVRRMNSTPESVRLINQLSVSAFHHAN